jgi:hypothetical protein
MILGQQAVVAGQRGGVLLVPGQDSRLHQPGLDIGRVSHPRPAQKDQGGIEFPIPGQDHSNSQVGPSIPWILSQYLPVRCERRRVAAFGPRAVGLLLLGGEWQETNGSQEQREKAAPPAR